MTATASPEQNVGGKLPRLAYNLNETAEILGISYMSVFRLVKRGKLKSCKSFRHHMIPATQIEAFLKEEVK